MREIILFAFLVVIVTGPMRAQDYILDPDSQRRPGVPKGTVTQQSWASRIYPGTVRVPVVLDNLIHNDEKLGVQVCDQPGRVPAIINPPGRAGVSDVFFGGPNLQWLYITDGDKVYRRPVKRRGTGPWNAVKPPQPRL